MGDTGFGRVYYGVCVVVVSIGICSMDKELMVDSGVCRDEDLGLV